VRLVPYTTLFRSHAGRGEVPGGPGEHVRDGTTGLPGDDLRGYGALLRRLIDARSHPHLHDVVEAGVFEDDDNPDYDFEFGLERLLDGVESLIRGRQDPPAAPQAPSA